jgi:hypothetical protein
VAAQEFDALRDLRDGEADGLLSLGVLAEVLCGAVISLEPGETKPGRGRDPSRR